MFITVTRPQLEFIAAYYRDKSAAHEDFDLFYLMVRDGEQHYIRLGGVSRPYGITENFNPKYYRMWCFEYHHGTGRYVDTDRRKHYAAIVRLLEQKAAHAVLFNFEQLLLYASIYYTHDMKLFYTRSEKFEISTEVLW